MLHALSVKCWMQGYRTYQLWVYNQFDNLWGIQPYVAYQAHCVIFTRKTCCWCWQRVTIVPSSDATHRSVSIDHTWQQTAWCIVVPSSQWQCGINDHSLAHANGCYTQIIHCSLCDLWMLLFTTRTMEYLSRKITRKSAVHICCVQWSVAQVQCGVYMDELDQ